MVGSKPWLQRYVATQRQLLAEAADQLRCPRAVLVRPHLKAGLGNRLRVLEFGLFLAVLTDRLLILDYPTRTTRSPPSEVVLLKPSAVQWDASRFPQHLRGCWNQSLQRRGLSVRRLPFNGRGMFSINFLPELHAPHVLLLDGWNHDVTPMLQRAPQLQSALRERYLDVGSFAEQSAPFAAQALSALFKPSQVLARKLDRVQIGHHIDAAVHVRVNIRANSTAAHGGTTDEQTWRDVATLMASCILGQLHAKINATVYLASNEAYVVETMRHAIQDAGHTPHNLPVMVGSYSHSGLVHGEDATTALLELLLLAKAERFVGTAGSSFSEQSLLLGAGSVKTIMFKTPFTKSKIRGSIVLPPSASQARVACAHDSATDPK